MAKKSICIVTSSAEGRGAYAITVDSDESVYVPVSVADALEIEEFEEIEAIMVRNDRADPVWRAIRVRRLDDATE